MMVVSVPDSSTVPTCKLHYLLRLAASLDDIEADTRYKGQDGSADPGNGALHLYKV